MKKNYEHVPPGKTVLKSRRRGGFKGRVCGSRSLSSGTKGGSPGDCTRLATLSQHMGGLRKESREERNRKTKRKEADSLTNTRERERKTLIGQRSTNY